MKYAVQFFATSLISVAILVSSVHALDFETEGTLGCRNCDTNETSLSRKNQRQIGQITKKVKSKAGQWSDIEEISNYSNSLQVEGALNAARANSKTRSAGLCLALVKYAACRPSARPGEQYEKYRSSRGGRRTQWPSPVGDQRCERGSLFGTGVTSPPVVHAKNMGNHLDGAPYNFVNMLRVPKYKARIRGPDDAPKGAILVYKKRRKPACDNSASGHIEIRGGDGYPGYMSDYRRDIPVSRQPRKMKSRCYELTGVYVRTDFRGAE